MIVTVSIREENGQSSTSVTASVPPSSNHIGDVSNAVIHAGGAAIAEAVDKGWIDSTPKLADITLPDEPAPWEPHVHKVIEARLPLTGDDGHA